MPTIAVIPSRYGSKRFQGKSLAPIAGLPMIQRVYEQAKKAAAISRVIVATDDKRIFDTVESFGGEAVITSQALRSGTDRVALTADLLKLGPDEIIVNIQGDQPLFNPNCIDELVAPLFDNDGLTMSTLVYKITDKREITDPKDVKVTFDNDGSALYFSRSTIPFERDKGTNTDVYKHLGFYAYKKSFLDKFASWPSGRLENCEKLEQLRALENGHKIQIVVTEHDSPEVDLPEDIQRIEKRLTTP